MSRTAPWAKERHSLLDRLFRISLVFKGIDGVLELAGGVLFLFVRPSTIDRSVSFLTRHELAEDPHDFVANIVIRTAQHLSVSSKLVASIYLLAHGVIKVILVAGLFTERKRFYPPALAFLGLFVLLEVGRLAKSFSVGILVLMVLDLFVITMVYIEYRRLR